jgi:hypothetical protein
MPVLQNPTSPAGFPGLYAFSLHDQCFVDDKTLLVTSQWYSMTVILKVDLDSGAVVPVTSADPTQGSWSLQVGEALGTGAQARGGSCLPGCGWGAWEGGVEWVG